MDPSPPPTVTTVERPDLPALAAVSVGSLHPTVLGVIVAVASLLGLPAVGFISYWQQVSEQGFAVGPLIILYTLSVLWLLFRVLAETVSVSTDAHGLEVRNLLCRRFAAWSEVRRVDTRQSCLAGGRIYRIQTTHGVLRLSESLPDGRTASGAHLIASVWQHLRRVGLADGMKLSPHVTSLWAAIPQELAISHTYIQLPAGPSPVPVWIILSALFLLSGVLAICVGNDRATASNALPIFAVSGSPCALLAVGLLCCSRWAKRVIARSALLAPEGFVAKTEQRLVVLPWADITRVRWLYSGHPWMTLLLGASDPAHQIVIRCRAEDDTTELFLLALIRQLRANASPPAVLLPLPLRDRLGSLQALPQPLAADMAPALLARQSGIEAKDRPFG